MSNVYYDPADFGLTTVGEVEWTDESYEFDLTVVWKDVDGNLYWADDSGCSCPSPFEDFSTIDQLDKGNFFDLVKHLDSRKEKAYSSHAKDEVVDLLSRLRLAE